MIVDNDDFGRLYRVLYIIHRRGSYRTLLSITDFAIDWRLLHLIINYHVWYTPVIPSDTEHVYRLSIIRCFRCVRVKSQLSKQSTVFNLTTVIWNLDRTKILVRRKSEKREWFRQNSKQWFLLRPKITVISHFTLDWRRDHSRLTREKHARECKLNENHASKDTLPGNAVWYGPEVLRLLPWYGLYSQTLGLESYLNLRRETYFVVWNDSQ